MILLSNEKAQSTHETTIKGCLAHLIKEVLFRASIPYQRGLVKTSLLHKVG